MIRRTTSSSGESSNTITQRVSHEHLRRPSASSSDSSYHSDTESTAHKKGSSSGESSSTIKQQETPVYNLEKRGQLAWSKLQLIYTALHEHVEQLIKEAFPGQESSQHNERNTNKYNARAMVLGELIINIMKAVRRLGDELHPGSSFSWPYELEYLNFNLRACNDAEATQKLENLVIDARHLLWKAAGICAQAGYPENRNAKKMLGNFKDEVIEELKGIHISFNT